MPGVVVDGIDRREVMDGDVLDQPVSQVRAEAILSGLVGTNVGWIERKGNNDKRRTPPGTPRPDRAQDDE